MASNGVDFADVRRRVAAFRKPELLECLERLGMRKSGNKPELQQRLLDIFENSCHLVSNGYNHRDMWRVTSAQRIIEDVYNKACNGAGAAPAAAAAAGGSAAAAAAAGGAAAAAAGGAGAAAAGSGPHAGAPDAKPRQPQQQQQQIPAAAAPAPANPVASALQSLLRQPQHQPNPMPTTVTTAAPAPGGAPTTQPNPRSLLPPSRAAAVTNSTIRCTCGATTGRPPLVQCAACGVWQHPQCAGLALGERPAGGGRRRNPAQGSQCRPQLRVVAAAALAVQDAGQRPAVAAGLPAAERPGVLPLPLAAWGAAGGERGGLPSHGAEQHAEAGGERAGRAGQHWAAVLCGSQPRADDVHRQPAVRAAGAAGAAAQPSGGAAAHEAAAVAEGRGGAGAAAAPR
ncbi:hypothetical protein Agub_g8465 [Astrephomene gubernaculifera]|uniref:SAP domain-containing protein n=1 Tax=Astrephomene gubernaculifera TaxID=47775 RepID=A0AAD3DRP5_9CHLO|nr:hypothetical protein Agub_g8465 [Astrephomene gubernaculifera]